MHRILASFTAIKTVTALTVFIALYSQNTSSALPPKLQNLKDLDVLISFVKENAKVLSTLESIELRNKVVRFGNGCTAFFERKKIERTKGWVGPAAPLVFVRSACKLED